MSDSPFYKSPIDPKERPILDKLVQIRDSLELLKADKSKYIKSQDVVTYYDKLIEQVHALNEIRTTKREEQNRRTSSPHVKIAHIVACTFWIVQTMVSNLASQWTVYSMTAYS